jgi:trimethylamine--corrinoid protein Co-methyltransferase
MARSSAGFAGGAGLSGGAGRLECLTREELLAWHHESLTVLETIGVKVRYGPALKLLREAGCEVSERDGVVRVPQRAVEEAIRLAPARFPLGGRDPAKGIMVGGNEVHLTGTGSCVNVLDFESGKRREATFSDLEEIVRLEDALDNLEAVPSPVSPGDALPPGSSGKGLYVKVFAGMVKNTGKHLINQAESAAEVRDHVDIMAAAAGSREEALRRNLVSFVCCFKSPFIYGDTNVEVLFECAKLGLPVLVETDPISGATAPVTLAGLLIQQNAELLFGITLAQLVRPGAPVLYTHAPTVMDMRTGDVSEGCPERSLYYIYCAQICRFYDIPSCGVAGTSDSKLNDLQSGMERAATLLCALLAGYNLNYDAAGAINGVLTTSLEGIVADDELYGYLRRILRGVDFSPETVRGSMEVLARVAHTGKSFLTERHTKDNLRREHWAPTIMDRNRYEVYEQSGSLGMRELAREKAKKILAEHRPVPLPEAAVKEIDEIVERAQART